MGVGVMSLHVERECISSVPFSSLPHICALGWGWGAMGLSVGPNQQVDPCHCLEMFSVSVTLPPFSAAEECSLHEWVFEESRTIGSLSTLV